MRSEHLQFGVGPLQLDLLTPATELTLQKFWVYVHSGLCLAGKGSS